jgi:hypothetical protein
MLIHPYHDEIDRQRRREAREEVRRRRLAAQGRPPRRIRRVVGRSIVRIGSRLASDPIPELARSR